MRFEETYCGWTERRLTQVPQRRATDDDSSGWEYPPMGTMA